ncbi:MAG: carbon starvation protein A, partial [Acetobacteraceae bacterium]|nr:carbon starvation protein A [Acetobacteraceae bacterium]
FGTANQMLAAIALTLCTVVLFKMKQERFAWVTIVPTTWLVLCTVTAGVEKVFSPNADVSFVTHASKYMRAAEAGQVLAPAHSLQEMSRIAINDYVDAALAAVFVIIVLAMVLYGVTQSRKALASPKSTAIEVGIAGAMAGGGDD